MRYHTFNISITGKAFASDEDVRNYILEVRADGGMCSEEQAAKAIIEDQINDLFDTDYILKLNEIIYE